MSTASSSTTSRVTSSYTTRADSSTGNGPSPAGTVSGSSATNAVAAASSSSSSLRPETGTNGGTPTKSGGGFDDRQRIVWKEMHERMDRRRQEWNSQVDRMRKDFFHLSTGDDVGNDADRKSASGRKAVSVVGTGSGISSGGGSTSTLPLTVNQSVYVEPLRNAFGSGSVHQFQATFDLSQFRPDEITVRTDGRRLMVTARHEQTSDEKRSSFSREFSRQIDIPRHVDVSSLRCTVSKDGILRVDANQSSSPTHIRSVRGPLDDSPPSSLPSPTGSLNTVSSLPSGPIVTDPDGIRRFRVSVIVGFDFLPEELTVKTVDRKLYVEAHHEETGPGRRSTCRELNREFDIPDCVDPDTVTAHMTEDGCLVLEAPVGVAWIGP